MHRGSIRPVFQLCYLILSAKYGLRKRGDFTVYITEEAVVEWHPAKTGVRGCPQKYSVLAIEVSLRRFPRMNLPKLRRIFVHFQGVKRGA